MWIFGALPISRFIEVLLAIGRSFDRVFEVGVSSASWVLLLDFDGVKFDASGTSGLLDFYVLQSADGLLLDLERELLVDIVRL